MKYIDDYSVMNMFINNNYIPIMINETSTQLLSTRPSPCRYCIVIIIIIFANIFS